MREIDDDGFAVAGTDKDVEFVEVSVYESRTREPDDKVHQLGVEFTRRRQLVDLTPSFPCSMSYGMQLIETKLPPTEGRHQ